MVRPPPHGAGVRPTRKWAQRSTDARRGLRRRRVHRRRHRRARRQPDRARHRRRCVPGSGRLPRDGGDSSDAALPALSPSVRVCASAHLTRTGLGSGRRQCLPASVRLPTGAPGRSGDRPLRVPHREPRTDLGVTANDVRTSCPVTLNLEDGSAEDELADDRRDHRWVRFVGHVTVPGDYVDPSIGE